ncbi:MAG: hypothetical protein Q4E91_11215 [Lachnospiraceae bacterium]|nr:hypothetical protein [Lachnospiraceae bacterium]
MSICVICGENFGDRYHSCPVCGCPRDRYTIAGLGFPKILERQYVLAGLKEGSGGQRYLSLMSRNTGKRILAGKIPADDQALGALLLRQKESGSAYFPMVYETAEQAGEVFFLFEEIPGETLKERGERESPESLPLPDAQFVEEVRKKMEMPGGTGAALDPGSCIWTGDGFRLRDFGAPSAYEETSGGEKTEKKGFLLFDRRVQFIIIAVLSVIFLAELFALLHM